MIALASPTSALPEASVTKSGNAPVCDGEEPRRAASDPAMTHRNYLSVQIARLRKRSGFVRRGTDYKPSAAALAEQDFDLARAAAVAVEASRRSWRLFRTGNRISIRPNQPHPLGASFRSIARSASFIASALVLACPRILIFSNATDHFQMFPPMPWTSVYSISRYFIAQHSEMT